MKKSDIAILILIVAISLGASYFIGQALLAQFKQGDATVEKVDTISAEIIPPDPKIFHKDAINPAVPINIGESINQQPFGQ